MGQASRPTAAGNGARRARVVYEKPMIHRRAHVLITLLLCLPLTIPGRADAQTSATLVGRVLDASGGVLPGVTVSARQTETGLLRTAVSDTEGRYRIPALPPGLYDIRGELASFRPFVRSGVSLTIAQTAVVDLTLTVGGVAEEVTVVGDASPVNTRTGELSYLVDARAIEELPLNGRNYTDLALLQPNVVAYPHRDGGSVVAHGLGMSVNGQDPRSNVYLLDGTLLNDMTNGPAGSAAGTALGMETVQEFRVETNAYSAEFGRMSGGQINVLTKAGGNSVRGSAYEFHRNDALDAKNYFDVNGKPAFTRNQFGGAIGGPIRRDRAVLLRRLRGAQGESRPDDLADRAGRQRAARLSAGSRESGRAPERRRQSRRGALSQRVSAGQRPRARRRHRHPHLPVRPDAGPALRAGPCGLQRRRRQSALRALHAGRCGSVPADGLPAVPALLRVAQPVLHRRIPAGPHAGHACDLSVRLQPDAGRAAGRGQHVHAAPALRARARVRRQHRRRRPQSVRDAELGRRALPAAGVRPAGRPDDDARPPPAEDGRPLRALPAGHGQPDVQSGDLLVREPARVSREPGDELHRADAGRAVRSLLAVLDRRRLPAGRVQRLGSPDAERRAALRSDDAAARHQRPRLGAHQPHRSHRHGRAVLREVRHQQPVAAHQRRVGSDRRWA